MLLYHTGRAAPLQFSLWTAVMPALVFLLGLCVAAGAAIWNKSDIDSDANTLFQHGAQAVAEHVQAQLQRPIYGLQGASGMYAGSPRVDRAKFRAYVGSRDLPREFPGVRGFAFIQRVLRPELGAFIAAERTDGAPQFALHQLDDKTHDDLYIVKFIEPAANNVGAQGLDIGSEAMRRAAIQRAVDTGEASISAAITLVQDSRKTPGLLAFLPVYAIGSHPTTVAQRRASLRGLLNAPLVMSELLGGMSDVRDGQLDFELFDGPVMPAGGPASQLLFDADKHTAHLDPLAALDQGAVAGRRFSATQTLRFAGRDLVLRVNSTTAFDARIDRTTPWLLLLGGTLLGAMLAFLLRQQAMGQRRANARALEMMASANAYLDQLQLQKFAMDQHAIVSTTDVHGKIIYVNDKFCEISGYSHEELLGQDHRILNSGTHTTGYFKGLYRTVGAGKTWQGEICNKAKDGQLYWVDSTIVPVMTPEGKPEQYLSIRSDITLRKKVELDLIQQQLSLEKRVQQKTKAAVQSEQHLRLVMNTSLDSIIGMDAQGRVTEWSRQAEATFGWTFAKVKGRYLHDFIIPLRYREAHQKGLAHYHATGVGPVLGKRIEVIALHRDGTEFPVELAISPIVTPLGTAFSAYVTDLTQRKQEQAALVDARALAESASRAKSDFLANMSHEIRTPMNGVIGMVDVLQETALLPEQKRMLGTIHTSSLALLQILNDILDFSKIEAGKLEVERVPMHLREVADGVAQLMVSLPGTQAEVSLFVSTALPVWAYGDPSRLRQVLLNLLGNAIKFSKKTGNEGAQVSLSVTPCVLPGGADGVRFAVVDTGIGMGPEVVAKLFQPFTQADESTARKFGGTGLGLSISQRLVELMGGHISVRSTLDQGSEFTVELPLQAAPPERVVPDEPRLDGVQVLVVSCSAFGVPVRTAYCEHAGALVRVVADVAQAREFLAQAPLGKPWVVLVDKAVSAPTAELGLPDHASVVREVPRGGQQHPGDIVLPTRPMLHHDLIQAIAHASRRQQTGSPGGITSTDRAIERRTTERSAAPTVEQAVRTGRLILLAEDNETNREVMQEQLRMLGYTCETAEDGAVALHMWQANPGRYALLLSDCHMPRLDGFGLTAAIRSTEAAGTRLPIIAVTANAMQGEAQRCHERGMDDYLSKPLRMVQLREKLEKWLPQSRSEPSATGPAESAQSAPVESVQVAEESATDSALALWNPDTLTELVGDNPVMHRRLLERFLANAATQVAEITAAATAQAPDALAGVAHTLKSAARSVGALRLGDLCQDLETAGRAGDVPSCEALAQPLPAAFAAASHAIQTHLSRAI